MKNENIDNMGLEREVEQNLSRQEAPEAAQAVQGAAGEATITEKNNSARQPSPERTQIWQQSTAPISQAPVYTQAGAQPPNIDAVQANIQSRAVPPQIPTPPGEGKKKKADPIKWTAIALAAVFATTTVFSVAAAGKVKLKDISGTVTAVQGNSITVSVSGKSASFGNAMKGMFGNMQQGTPPDTQTQQSTQEQQTGDSDSDSTDNSDEAAREAPQQNTQAGEPGQMPDGTAGMRGDFAQEPKGDSESSSGEITVKLSAGTTVSEGNETISAKDIEVGDTVTIHFGTWNTVKNVEVSDAATTAQMPGNNQNGSFNGFPGGGFGDNTQPEQNENQQENSDNTSQG